MKKIQEKGGWKNLPKGWHDSSVKKFGKSLVKGGATKEGFFDKCVEKMKGHVANPEGFCAGAKDKAHGSTYWRGKDKTPQQAGKDVKAHQNVKHEHLVNTYLHLLECGCEEDMPKYGDDPDPLAHDGEMSSEPERFTVLAKCLQIDTPLVRLKCLKLIKALGLDRNNPDYEVKVDREIDAITGNYEPSGEM